MKRRIVVGLVFLLAVGLCAGLIWFNFFRDKMITQFFATMQQPPQTISAAKVEAKTWTPSIGAIGTAKAANGVELAFEIAGIVERDQVQGQPGGSPGRGPGAARRHDRARRHPGRAGGREDGRKQLRARPDPVDPRLRHRGQPRSGERPARRSPLPSRTHSGDHRAEGSQGAVLRRHRHSAHRCRASISSREPSLRASRTSRP